MKKRALGLLTTVALLGFIIFAVLNLQAMKDRYVVQTSSLQPAAAHLESDLDLTKTGSFLFAASQPEVQTATQFNESCGSVAREQSIVLGCYAAQRIYIYKVDDSRLKGVEQVTAAHELLHGVYDRMSEGERQRIDKLLEDQAKNIDDIRLKTTIAEYQKTEPTQVVNELHSIFGTEVSVLSPKLEEHYRKYFLNRQKIVDYANQYEQTFTNINQKIDDYDTKLTALKNQKDEIEDALKTKQHKIEADKQNLSSLRRSGNVDAYNNAVPNYNQQIREYNSQLEQLKAIINEYNDLVIKRNTLATTQIDLIHQLDSKYQPLDR